jgi:anti-sigma28 factor (negative regulator of flagellin synthesis)
LEVEKDLKLLKVERVTNKTHEGEYRVSNEDLAEKDLEKIIAESSF